VQFYLTFGFVDREVLCTTIFIQGRLEIV